MSIPREEKYKAKMCGYYAAMEGRENDPEKDPGYQTIKTEYIACNYVLEVYYRIGYLMGKELEDNEDGTVIDMVTVRTKKIREEICKAFDFGMKGAFSAIPPFPRMDDFFVALLGDEFEQQRDTVLQDAWEEGYDAGLSAMEGVTFKSVVDSTSLASELNSYRANRENERAKIRNILDGRKK